VGSIHKYKCFLSILCVLSHSWRWLKQKAEPRNESKGAKCAANLSYLSKGYLIVCYSTIAFFPFLNNITVDFYNSHERLGRIVGVKVGVWTDGQRDR